MAGHRTRDLGLSKSRLLELRQCPRRLWLSVHRPGLLDEVPAATARSFQVGNEVGELARALYDPKGRGVLIARDRDQLADAIDATQDQLRSGRPLFEAGFSAAGAVVFADVLLPAPAGAGSRRGWRLVEVKSAASVKQHVIDDVAIQVHVAREAGLTLAGCAVAHIDSTFVYAGDGSYAGLLKEHDVSAEVDGRRKEVAGWIDEARAVLRRRKEPAVATGAHCGLPYTCGYLDHCSRGEAQAEFPISWLPRFVAPGLTAQISERSLTDMRQVPDAQLNEVQARVKACTLSGFPYFDARAARKLLAAHRLPACFLDFETIAFAIPVWAGTTPYKALPFQFSVHRLARNGTLRHEHFLDLSGDDPSPALARALVSACGEAGPVFAYNATFERKCISSLAVRVPKLAKRLQAIEGRLVDLLPVAKKTYYHPSQRGSWSLKRVLPAIAPALSHGDLDGVQDGNMAMDSYREAVAVETAPARKAQIEHQLLEYCKLDTLALVHLWDFLSGRCKLG